VEERTEQELIEAAQELVIASVNSVGMTNTYDTLQFLSKIIRESPDTYSKIFKPETLEKLTQIAARAQSGKKLGITDALQIFNDLSSIL
jgi:hypothetical protein